MKGGFFMKETKLQSEMLDIIANNNGLKMYLSGLSKGRTATPRSNLYNMEGKTRMLAPDEILAEWMKQLKSLENKDSFCKNVFQFDSHQLEKWGPQGEVAPIEDLLEDIVYPTFSGSEKIPAAFSTPEWQQAKREVVRKLHRFGCVGLSPVPYRRVIDDMRARDTLESNSGWPLFTKRHNPEVIEQSIQEAENGLWKTYPAIALFRNYNRKTRLVWMFPMSANLVEGSFFQPLLHILVKAAREHKPGAEFLSPWVGFEEVREVVSTAYSMGYSIAASDFSSTDAHFQLAATMEVFDVIKECFQPRFRDLLRESMVYMHKIPLIISSDSMLEGDHGVSSGSNWTNYDETIFDWILAEYVAIVTKKFFGLYAIGDDMSWKTKKYDPKFAELLEEFGKSVGQQIKADKTTNDPDKVVSLQRLFQKNYVRPDGLNRAVYPTIRALKSLVYPERFHKPELWSKDMEAVRAIMILENCVDHPLFEDFCKFVVAGDPHIKEFCDYSPSLQQKLLRKSKLVPGLNPTYNQERRDSGISSFESVKFIRQM
jgi:hypothetical protein